MPPRRLLLLIALGALGVRAAVGLSPAHAADAPVDAGLLEFLGSVDSDDQAWHAYLARSAASRTSYTPCSGAACQPHNAPPSASAPPPAKAAAPAPPPGSSPPPAQAGPP